MSTPEVGRRTSTTTIDSPMAVNTATIGDLTMRMARVSQARSRSTDCGGQRRSTCGEETQVAFIASWVFDLTKSSQRLRRCHLSMQHSHPYSQPLHLNDTTSPKVAPRARATFLRGASPGICLGPQRTLT